MITNINKEDKELLLKDLCGRIPYGVIVKIYDTEQGSFDSFVKSIGNNIIETEPTKELNYNPYVYYKLTDCKPYLRTMSSMTEEEHMKLKSAYDNGSNGLFDEYSHIDWLNSHHFDYRNLIEKKLALEAPKDMYKF